jgi:uncharacterized iron-regulated membrane protein
MGRDVNGKFRKILFWLHLIAGVIAGVVIFIMSATGVALAFQPEIVAWMERDVRRVTPPTPDAKPLRLEELFAKLRAERPGERPASILIEADPTIALAVSYGPTNTFFVNPYSGAVRPRTAEGTRQFMQLMIDWHRFLGGHEEKNRARGKAITGACNVAFLFLAVSGLYLWWPRQWTKKILASVGLMNFKLRGKARDFNWHNAVGLWCAPVLIVLTATAMPISYRWAGDLIYKLTGSTPPTQGAGPGGMATPAVEVPAPPPGSKPLGMEALFAVAQREFPNWQQISYRSGGGRGGRANASATATTNTNAPALETTNAPTTNRERSERAERRGEGAREGQRAGQREGRGNAQPVTLTVKTQGQWPLFSSAQITLDPFTGNILQREGFSDQNLGRQVRSWTRYLHTGEALGVVGKAGAGLASAGALLLVWTGFALTWRRFFTRAPKAD